MLNKPSSNSIYELFKNKQMETIRIFSGKPKTSNNSYVTHSDEFSNYYNSGNSYSSNISYSSNNSCGYSERNVTFTSLLG